MFHETLDRDYEFWGLINNFFIDVYFELKIALIQFYNLKEFKNQVKQFEIIRNVTYPKDRKLTCRWADWSFWFWNWVQFWKQ